MLVRQGLPACRARLTRTVRRARQPDVVPLERDVPAAGEDQVVRRRARRREQHRHRRHDRAAVADHQDALAAVRVPDLVQHAGHPRRDPGDALAARDRRRVVARRPRPRRPDRAPRPRPPSVPASAPTPYSRRPSRTTTSTPSTPAAISAVCTARDSGLHQTRAMRSPRSRSPSSRAWPAARGAERPAVVGDQVGLVVGLAVAGEEDARRALQVAHGVTLAAPGRDVRWQACAE